MPRRLGATKKGACSMTNCKGSRGIAPSLPLITVLGLGTIPAAAQLHNLTNDADAAETSATERKAELE